MITLSSKYDGEHIVASFDFASGLATGETLTSIVSVTASLNSGSGTITLGTYGIVGTSISCPISGGVAGSSYVIKAICDTSNVNKRLEIAALLPVM
jgi:hypothetical protein